MTTDTVMLEVQQRTRRIETRLMRLCEHQGLDATGGRTKMRVVYQDDGRPSLELQGYDVSIADCLRFCQEEGIVGNTTLTCRGETLGTLAVRHAK